MGGLPPISQRWQMAVKSSRSFVFKKKKKCAARFGSAVPRPGLTVPFIRLHDFFLKKHTAKSGYAAHKSMRHFFFKKKNVARIGRGLYQAVP